MVVLEHGVHRCRYPDVRVSGCNKPDYLKARIAELDSERTFHERASQACYHFVSSLSNLLLDIGPVPRSKTCLPHDRKGSCGDSAVDL